MIELLKYPTRFPDVNNPRMASDIFMVIWKKGIGGCGLNGKAEAGI